MAGNNRSAHIGTQAWGRLHLLLPMIVLVTGTVAACSGTNGFGATPTVPLITSKPFVEPEPTDTPEPTKKPLSVTAVSLTEAVQGGDEVTVVISTASSAQCVIEVTYDSGPSEDPGLGVGTADGDGTVTWSWTVAADTPRGTYPIDITCFKGARNGALSLEFKVR